MRIVISPKDDGDERRVTVYDRAMREKEAEFFISDDQQAELEMQPRQCSSGFGESAPRDAAEVWATIDFEGYRVLSQ